jgi:hypothetical protein
MFILEKQLTTIGVDDEVIQNFAAEEGLSLELIKPSDDLHIIIRYITLLQSMQ